MVNPIHIFTIALGAAFLLSLFDKIGRRVSRLAFFLALCGMTFISGQWFFSILSGGASEAVFTAGFLPPFSINLQFGLAETFFTFAVHVTGLLTALFMLDKWRENGSNAMLLFLMMIMGISGLIMTRDLFNLFVFMEITSIATYSLIGLERDHNTLAAGFKYIIAGGIASALYLIGTIYLYRLTGTLNIDTMIASRAMLTGTAGFVALFLLLAAILIELKPFPANGWALDVYQAVNSGTAAVIAVASSAGMFFALYKILPLLSISLLPFLAGVGIVTFLFSNLMAIRQNDAKRLLGYSSIGQMGLLLTAVTLLMIADGGFGLSRSLIYIGGGLFINHLLAKAGLFWIAGSLPKEKLADWSFLRSNSVLLFSFGAFIFALAGLPPFPGFWAKWDLILHLSSQQMYIWIGLILLGSLLEIVYLTRWLGRIVHHEEPSQKDSFAIGASRLLPILIFLFLIFNLGFVLMKMNTLSQLLYWLPLLAGGFIFALDWLPKSFKAIFTLAFTGIYAYLALPAFEGLRLIFAILFLGGAAIQTIATLGVKSNRRGFYPLLVVMILSLGNLLYATTTLQFFFAWELMTLSSYLLLLRGRQSEQAALRYILFSMGGAFLILIGLGLSYAASGSLSLQALFVSGLYGPWIYALLTAGFLIKTGAIGVHVWLPNSYAEAEDDFSAMLSSLLSKAGIFGLLIVAGMLGRQYIGSLNINTALGWIGVMTAFFGALMAVFQEDIKRLLAYSSMGQVGYMVFALAMMSHLGWVTALYLSFNHLFFKALLFIAIAGVISRTGTRYMYQMGGLIRKMPFSFISVLIAIIALSGVPPLSGFGGKWLLYTAGIEKGWYLQTGLAFFASTIAFLYCFRLIHTIFLGQPKPQFTNIRDASLWYHIPAYLFIAAIMAISMYPKLILKPLMNAVSSYFPATLQWDGYTVISSLGYWNGNTVMYVTMGVFMLPLILLVLTVGFPQRVRQFNIVFAAERPDRPETTHFAYNFFAPYRKALGFLVWPAVERFWQAVAEWTQSLAQLFRMVYSGNGQTYAFHILLFVVALYFIMGGTV